MKLHWFLALIVVFVPALPAFADTPVYSESPQYDGLFVSAANAARATASHTATGGGAGVRTAGAASYLQVPVLVMIYTNYTYDHVSEADVAKLLSEMEEAERFYWRNSLMKCDLKIDYLIIDRTLTLDQFWELWEDSYWLQWWSTDGVHSVQKDLIANGVEQGDYAGVFVFYAWENTEGAVAAIGGGTYGVDYGPFPNCAYSSVPLCWDPETNDWFFIHEFHHQLDSMFDFSGHPEYPHADRPGDYAVDFNDGYEFNAWMLRTCDYWSGMNRKWGKMINYTDSDADGVPDSGAGLTITEETEGTDPYDWDTDHDGLSDLGEAAAHYMRGADPHNRHSDADGRADAVDRYPLDPCPEYVTRHTPTVDAYINAGEYDWFTNLHTDNDADCSATLYLSWDSAGLYVAVDVTDDRIDCPWDDPWWDDSLEVQLDAANDGYEWHGIDNYELHLAPRGSNGIPIINVRIKTIDGDRFDLVGNSDITAKYRKLAKEYIIEARIPTNSTTGLVPGVGDVIGTQFSIVDYDYYPGWPRYYFFSRFVDLTMIESAETTTAPGDWLNAGWNWFSIPLDPIVTAEASALLNYNVDNILYRWNAGTKTIELYPNDFTILESGHGYVLRLPGAIAPSYLGYPRSGPYEITIPEAGWTWIGHPKASAALQANVKVRNELTQQVRSPGEDAAAADPWVNWNFLYWDSGGDTVKICSYGGGADDNALRPWYGYRVWSNGEDLKLIVP